MESAPLFDCAGRRRSPATFPGYHRGRPPRNKGVQYPPDPPTVEEIVAVMRAAGETPDGLRLRGLVVVLWRAGLRISEALALTESDLDAARGAILVRRGKGGKRREVGMDRWAWEQLSPWLRTRASLPVGGAVLCAARTDATTPVRTSRHPRPTPQDCRSGRRAAAVRPTSAPSRARRRDVSRRSSASRHTTPTRARGPWDHLGEPARDR
jgi:integrase